MQAVYARDRAHRFRTTSRLAVGAAIVLVLAASPARTNAEAGDAATPSQLTTGSSSPGGLRPVGPVVTSAPAPPTKQSSIEMPRDPGAPVVSDSDAAPPSAVKPPSVSTLNPRVEPPSADIRDPIDAKRESKSVSKSGPQSSRPIATIENLPPLPALAIDPAAFKGITPGVSTSDDLAKLWSEGVAAPSKDGPAHWLYKIEPYRRVEVTMADRNVAVIAVRLDKPFEPDALLKQLHLTDSTPVEVLDEAGQPLGEAVPERGILFSFAPETKLVTQMLLEPIDAEPFILRAAAQADAQPRRALRDLDFALSLDPKLPKAHAIRGQILSGAGRFDDALKSIEQAIQLDPKSLSNSVFKADILAHLDRHGEAIAIVKGLLGEPKLPPLVKAQALNQLGDLLAEGPDHDYKQAIELHLSAIKTAQALVADRRPDIRRDAKRVAVEAHLGAACDIGLGVWQQKEQIAARWINRADDLAKELIRNERADPRLRLHVARRALDARVGIQGRWDPSDWTAKALEEGQKLILSTNDPLRAERLQWEIGLALFDIGELDQVHGLSDHSLADSQITRRYLEEGTKHRQPTAEDTYLMGRLYAHIGVIEATRGKNHAAAIAWFEKAAPLLDRPLPPPAVVNLGRHGEIFVSMGISYWEAGRRDDAVRLTQKGADLMAEAVTQRLLDERAMAVPYGNLAAMHRDLGHTAEAREFAQTAARYDGAQRK